MTGERYDEVDLDRSALLEEELRRTTRTVVRARKVVTVASFVVWFLVGLALVSLVALLVAAPRRASETPPSPALPEPSRADDSALSPAPDPGVAARVPRSVDQAPPASGRASVSGTATFLCDPPRWPVCTRGYPESSYVAARGSELPRAWQGKLVRVFWRDRHVDVRLVDTCLCRGARIIDLYAVAFRDLAGSTGPGVLEGVRVALIGSGSIPLPPTDTR